MSNHTTQAEHRAQQKAGTKHFELTWMEMHSVLHGTACIVLPTWKHVIKIEEATRTHLPMILGIEEDGRAK